MLTVRVNPQLYGAMMTLEEEIHKKRLDSLRRHVGNVIRFAGILGERLIEKGEDKVGRKLIANSYQHDHSKFGGIEWLHLHADGKEANSDLFQAAVLQHVNTNKHHPEYWGDIHNMPRIFLAELVCDWAARSSEFGNDLREWIKDKATKKFDFKVQSKVYKEIKDLVDVLLDPSFA